MSDALEYLKSKIKGKKKKKKDKKKKKKRSPFGMGMGATDEEFEKRWGQIEGMEKF